MIPHGSATRIWWLCVSDSVALKRRNNQLWTEYLEECRLSGENPLMYSQFCYYIQQDEQKRRATMHISRKPGDQTEVDWAGDSTAIIDPDTGEITPAFIFVGVLTYSQYPYVEAFLDEKQVFILAEMYRRSGGTDTAVPVEVYRQTGTGYRLHHSG